MIELAEEKQVEVFVIDLGSSVGPHIQSELVLHEYGVISQSYWELEVLKSQVNDRSSYDREDGPHGDDDDSLDKRPGDIHELLHHPLRDSVLH